MDTDHSGFLEYSEIAKVAAQMGITVNDKEVQEIFEAADSNKDGKISFEEFVAWYRVGRTSKASFLLRQQLSHARQAQKMRKKLAEI